jgi:hypothetical protein
MSVGFATLMEWSDGLWLSYDMIDKRNDTL